jgi:magnesium chelatase family protein
MAKKLDMQSILGQEHVKRAMEVAASGGHSILLIGPLAAGKTTLAKAFQTIYDGKIEIEENVVWTQGNLLTGHRR